MQFRLHPAGLTRSLVVAALAAPLASPAVWLDPDGRGQALIFPYYTVQSASGNAFNTYISVVNHSLNSDKALRVRFRESRTGREVAALNLFLGRNDVWAAALVPDGAGTRLVTRDTSCTEPLLWSGQVGPGYLPAVTQDGLQFGNAAYSGSNADGAGEGLDRTREGYIEILEMATLKNVAPLNLAAAITHNSANVPANCGAAQAGDLATTAPAGTFTAPSGGLSGTLTLINVASGMDFSINAEALAQVASRPYFRASSDPYPSFAASEVDPVSEVSSGGFVFRSTWLRGVDAVSAALMRREASAEWTLEEVTASQSDFVFTFPTRHHYLTNPVSSPFTSARWLADCGDTGILPLPVGEQVRVIAFGRGQAGSPVLYGEVSPMPSSHDPVLCAAATVAPLGSDQAPPVASLLGSIAFGVSRRYLPLRAILGMNGFLSIDFARDLVGGATKMVSEADSMRIDIATGQSTSGRHTFRGLPLTGFAARTLRNGTLTCSSGNCQGNYGSAFPYTYRRDVAGP